ncbi:Pentatricopeptide repeat-containing protein At1g30610, chloroplastic [Linum perenne]
MEMPVMANRQVGLPHPETSCSCRWIPDSPYGFPNSRQPVFSVPSSIKIRSRFGRIRIKAEKKDNQVDGVVDKELGLGFKPSFGEYLKVMEAVKTGRQRKLTLRLNDREMNGDGVNLVQRKAEFVVKEAVDGGNGNVSVQDKASKSSFRRNDKLPDSNGGDYRGAMADDGKLVHGRNTVRKENDVASNIQFNAKVDRKIATSKSSFRRYDKLPDSNGGDYQGAKADDGKLVHGRNTIRRENDVASNIQFNAKVDRKIGQKEMDGKALGGRNSRTNQELGNLNLVKVDKIQNVMANGSRITIRERDSTIESSSSATWVRKRNVFEGKDVGIRPQTTSYRPVANFLQAKEIITPSETVQKSGMQRERKLLYRGDNDSEVDRAAFKNLEDSDYVVRRTPPSKREMEDRIQKLANCINGADIDMPEWMFSKMVRSAKIRIIYTTALHVLGKAKRPVEALNLFHSMLMLKRVSTYPDLVAYHSIAVTLGQAGYMKELFDVIDIMQSPPKKKNKEGFLQNWDPRLEPDVVVYNAVLNACVRRKQWEGAFWVLQQLKEKNQKPSAATYGLVMEVAIFCTVLSLLWMFDHSNSCINLNKVMFVCEKYNLVHEFFRKLQKSSIPDALAYRVLVNTLSKESKTDEAVLAVQGMESRGIVGSAALYYDLARCLCSAGRCEEALAQVDKICRVANKPLVVTYTGLIQACLEAGLTDGASHIFSHMKQFCSPNLITCNILLKGYLDHGQFEEARSLFDKMLEDGKHIGSNTIVGVVPDIYSFNTMLDACVAEQRWDDFGHVYETMLQHGHHFNAKRHEVVELTWKHLARSGRVPPPPVIKERFCNMLEKCDYVSAFECIAATSSEETPAFSRTSWYNLLRDNSHRLNRETVVQLLHKAKLLVSENNDDVNTPLRTLVTACDDFLRTSINK